MRIERFQRPSLVSDDLRSDSARCHWFLRVAGSDPGNVRESGANHQDGPALRGGFRPRILGRREARPAGRGQHFDLESREANSTGTATRAPISSFQQFGNDFGQQFNGPQNVPQQERTEKALGSGVIVSPEGYVLTNNHVVDGATDVTVTLHDKREFKARVVGTDSRTDIAVLKLDGSNFPALTLADSSKVQVGDIVLAVGNPFGVGQTVTAGIVSATSRGGLGIEQVEDFIQTDAPINPGNSGGALVDDEGHLIGINTAILSGNSGGNQGIGFAVPINMARHDMDEILAHGKVEHGYLGILPQDVTPASSQVLQYKRNERRFGGRDYTGQPGRAQ